MKENEGKSTVYKKKIKRKILIGVAAIFGPLIGFLTITMSAIAIVSGPEAFLPDMEPEFSTELQRVATYCGINWEELAAYVTVLNENNFEGVDPEFVAMDFLLVTYEAYHEEVETVKRQVSAINLGVAGAKPGQMVEVKEEIHTWVLDGTYTLENPYSIYEFASQHGCSEYTATAMVDTLRALDATDQYNVLISSKEVKDFMEYLSDDQKEWYNALVSENLIKKALGTYYELPESIVVDTNGFFAWPVPGITYITSYYGWRTAPDKGGDEFHKGVDAAEAGCEGSPIIAAAKGTVIDVQYKTTGYGYNITLQHVDADGHTWTTRYCHLSQIVVKIGQGVERGTVIGALGTSGRSTGPHLHFEIKYEGTNVDPLLLVEPE